VFPRRRSIGFFLVCLLLAMQALWIVHHFEHDDGEEAACEFCSSLHNMGTALPGAARALAALPFSEALPQGESAPRGDADPIQPRQQGPPRLS
jgi:hypothetical protein